MQPTLTFPDRLKELLAHFQLSPHSASQKLGHKGTTKFYRYVNGETLPSMEAACEMLLAWPDISADWLLLGLGPMLRSDIDTNKVPSTSTPKQGSDNGFVVAVTVDRTGNENIVHVPAHAQAGYSRHHDDPAYLRELLSYTLPVLRSGTFRSFEVEGETMKPTFGHSDIVIGQYVERWDQLLPGHCYVVVLADTVLVKRLPQAIRSKREMVALTSDNQAYTAHEVPASDIIELWLVRGHLSTNIPAGGRAFQDRLIELLEALGVDHGHIRRLLEERAPNGAPNSAAAPPNILPTN